MGEQLVLYYVSGFPVVGTECFNLVQECYDSLSIW